MDKQINDLLRILGCQSFRGLREIHMIAGDGVVLLLKGKIAEEYARLMLDSGAAGVAFENGDSIGRDYVTLSLNGMSYTATPWGFFQSNWNLNQKVVEEVIWHMGSLGGMKILDLYAGAGNFSLPLSAGAKEVAAVPPCAKASERSLTTGPRGTPLTQWYRKPIGCCGGGPDTSIIATARP